MHHESLQRWYDGLLSQHVRAVRVLPSLLTDPVEFATPPLVFPGAFNPLHAGHRAMADFAAQRVGQKVEFEISLLNVDKPPLAVDDVIRRVEQFPPHETVWLTCAARFTQKADLFAGATFIVGLDTIARLIDARYYDGDATGPQRAIEHLAARGCRFLVFGRSGANGFQSLSQLALPPSLAALCDEIPEADFRHDLSSTELRIAAGGS